MGFWDKLGEAVGETINSEVKKYNNFVNEAEKTAAKNSERYSEMSERDMYYEYKGLKESGKHDAITMGKMKGIQEEMKKRNS